MLPPEGIPASSNQASANDISESPPPHKTTQARTSLSLAQVARLSAPVGQVVLVEQDQLVQLLPRDGQLRREQQVETAQPPAHVGLQRVWVFRRHGLVVLQADRQKTANHQSQARQRRVSDHLNVCLCVPTLCRHSVHMPCHAMPCRQYCVWVECAC